jgi:AcrR family transcriptional regulator
MSRGVITRQRIVDQALRIASREGLEGVSLGELAGARELSKSGLFAHFRSKERLQIAMIEAAAARLVAQVVRPALARPRGEPRVAALLEGWLAWSRAAELPGGCVFVAAATELDDRPGPVRDALVEAQRQWLSTLARAAALAVGEGHFRVDFDPEQFALEAYALLLGFHHHHRLLGDPSAGGREHIAVERLLASARARAAAGEAE